MRLAELRTCDGCQGPLVMPPGRWFQVVRTTPAIFTTTGLEVLAAASRHRVPLERAEADRTGRPLVTVLGDHDPGELVELVLCVACYHTKPIAELARLRQECAASTSGRAERPN